MHRRSGESVIIRDLSSLKPDNYYVPALSIPYIGREIAAKNGTDFFDFWRINYSENLARTKARLLLDYGLEMVTPNSQNFLVELNSNWVPTGKIFIRDIGDSKLYEPWIKALKRTDLIQESIQFEAPFKAKLNPYAGNSHWRFSSAGSIGFSTRQVSQLYRAHDRAWTQEMKQLLNIIDDKIDSPAAMDTFLKTEAGQAAILKYKTR